MFKYQKDMLKAIAKNDKHTIYYFSRQMGKTYVINYLKKLGKVSLL